MTWVAENFLLAPLFLGPHLTILLNPAKTRRVEACVRSRTDTHTFDSQTTTSSLQTRHGTARLSHTLSVHRLHTRPAKSAAQHAASNELFTPTPPPPPSLTDSHDTPQSPRSTPVPQERPRSESAVVARRLPARIPPA